MRHKGLSEESRRKAAAWGDVHNACLSITSRTGAAEEIMESWYERSLRQFRSCKYRGNRPHPYRKKYYAIILGRVDPKFPEAVQATLIRWYGADRSNPSQYHCFFEGVLL